MSPTGLTREVKSEADRAGFARVGIARADRLAPEARQLDAWLDGERHGQMSWMAATAEVRKDPRHPAMLRGAQSVVVLAAPYLPTTTVEGPSPGRVAKYALGRDYHAVLHRKARRVWRLLTERGYATRVAVDSKPVLERAWAERAGVGFVGKNCCLIVPGIGSHVFLACLVTTAPLDADTPIERRCGGCSLCLEACPTKAFTEPRSLDARRCIAYLTIEHRGPIPGEHRSAIGPWLFGCDVCQDVCPYNQTARDATRFDAFEVSERWDGTDAAALLAMDEESFRAWASGSAVKRARYEGVARNAALVLGNRGERTHLRVLENASLDHPSPVVREAADWALRALNDRLSN